MAEQKNNPLFIHAIILCVMGGLVTIYGSVDLIKNITARDVMYADARVSSTTGMVRGATRMPTMRRGGGVRGALASARRLQMQGSRMKRILRRFASYGPALIFGIGMLVVGIFMLKRREWARVVGFALFGATALTIIAMMAVKMGSGGGLALPLTSIVLLTFAASKIEWDLMVEKFEAQPA